MDKVTEALLAALKQALAHSGEERLFKSGKLSGLFPGRAGTNAEAALRALQDGLLEVVRTESKGKTTIEWVRITPRGVNYLHDTEAPVVVLRELRAALQTSREGVPAWLAQLRQDFLAFETRMADDAAKYLQQLAALSRRVEEALHRAESHGAALPNGAAAAVPWASDALNYLVRRQDSGATGDCPLPELFAALRDTHVELSLTGFHDGLRRLTDLRALRLVPFTASAEQLPQPEYALLDGADVLYYAAR
ncbi:MAG: hypothetical protein K2R98_20285 [Gemmataceae bacterium]|nr:hypothetical protein [Gemmataceae bacterium]